MDVIRTGVLKWYEGYVSGTLLTLSLIAATGARAVAWQPPAGLEQVALWPGTPPGGHTAVAPELVAPVKKLVAGRPWTWVTNVSTPTITFFPPKGESTRAAVVVFPGGGYKGLAIDLEGTEVCDWLTSKGIACVLLKYRVPDTGHHWDDAAHRHLWPKVEMALQDAQRAISLVRHRAAEWRIDSSKIGVMGFSAGGHLVADVSTRFEKRAYRDVDDADKESCRPDFAVPVYPGHLLIDGKLNPRLTVASRTPPTFILHAADDPVDPVEYSMAYHAALKQAGAPVEMHLFAKGGHAFGLRPTKNPITGWPRLVEDWLRGLGVLAD